MASSAVMRQLASRGKLTPPEIEAIWKNYTQEAKSASDIAATLGHKAEWYQDLSEKWYLIASAEICLYRAVSDGPIKLDLLPKAARLWYRAHRHRLDLVEPTPGIITTTDTTVRHDSGPINISGDGSREAALINSGKAFLLGGNLLIPGRYDVRLGRDTRTTYQARWFNYKAI